ncbi:hypothetical protein QR680_019148 [Steinernema hermaphroditum]|uniref:Sodium-dependent phosphate transporter n=1 Tax=Steinernema hermaphroditum TaxID=289476 RepID=A0AA39HK37_9BILA|nr:hypothetical protein QR680_019148 [Steinernema hermaphroditum]
MIPNDVHPQHFSIRSGSVRNNKYIRWKDLSGTEIAVHLLELLLKVIAILLILFAFACSVNLLGEAFKLIASRGVADAISDNPLIVNIASAAIMGMVATLFLQSSTTVVNIVIGMISGNMITVRIALPAMMGAEVGGYITSAFIEAIKGGDPKVFRRTYAAATLHEVYNVCCVMVILPLEVAFGMIEKLSAKVAKPIEYIPMDRIKTLQHLTDPVVDRILKLEDEPTILSEYFDSPSANLFIGRCIDEAGRPMSFCPYNHIFAYSLWEDTTIALLVIGATIICLMLCLGGTVKIMESLLKGPVAVAARKLLHHKRAGVLGYFTGYIVMGFGCAVVMLIQSNNIFHSVLKSLVATGEVTVDRMYPLVVGGNIGVTFAGILAAFAADPHKLQVCLQVAFSQTIMNIIGMLLFYPLPLARNIPVHVAKQMGNITAKHRWFAHVVILTVFLIIPGGLLGLTYAPNWIILTVVGCVSGFVALITAINISQNKAPKCLPAFLRDWSFLPIALRSLDPYDKFMMTLCMSCCRTRKGRSSEVVKEYPAVIKNAAHYEKNQDDPEKWMRLAKHTQV